MINLTTGTYSNKAVLTVEPGLTKENCKTEASKASERFLCSAALLPLKSYLGIQIEFEAGKTINSFAFSGPNVKVTEDDYNWIFKGCAVATDNSCCNLSTALSMVQYCLKQSRISSADPPNVKTFC